MKRVINYSGGFVSLLTIERVVQEFGVDDLVLLFADTLIEDPDLYRLNSQVEQHYGIPITRISLGLTPWELFRKQGIIGNSKYPVCSVMLKREPLDAWHRAHCLEFDSILYVGFDWTEEHRLKAMREALPFWCIEAPMTKPPFLDRLQMINEVTRLGFDIPRAYVEGFPHNNCGRRCVQAGITHFVKLYHVDPPSFLEWEEEEQATIVEFERRGIAWKSFLKDRRGGETRSLTLRQLRARIEAGEKFSRFDWGGCGCGTAFTTPSTEPAPAL